VFSLRVPSRPISITGYRILSSIFLRAVLKKFMPHTIGVVLAGGTGSRLAPLTRTLNKHLLPVNGQPMLHWPIRTLALAGIGRIVVVLGGKNAGEIVEHFGSEYDVDGRVVQIAYVYQREAGGIGQALAVALPLVEELEGERVRVVLGDNVFPGLGVDLPDHAVGSRPSSEPRPHDYAVVVGVEGVPNPERAYGCVAVSSPHGYPVCSAPEEKPNRPAPDGSEWLALAGIYDFPVNTGSLGSLLGLIGRLAPSGRGEVEVTDLLAAFARVGRLTVATRKGSWIDAGEHEGYRKANDQAFWRGVTSSP
jgi:glucose-1-phosphate thymidylyltransferase